MAVRNDVAEDDPRYESCDDQNDVATDACLPGYVAARCGDGIVHEGVEQCDDGNNLDGDGCEADCTFCAAFRFDGIDDYVSIQNPQDLFYFGEFTVEAWVRWDGIAKAHEWSVIAGHGTRTRLFRLQLHNETGQVFFDTEEDGRDERFSDCGR